MKSTIAKTILVDILERYPKLIEYFDKKGKRMGRCIMCESLFEPLEEVVKKYNLNIEEIEKIIRNSKTS